MKVGLVLRELSSLESPPQAATDLITFLTTVLVKMEELEEEVWRKWRVCLPPQIFSLSKRS